MRPIRLEISGLNSYIEKQVVDFSELTSRGLFGIFGKTGSGKSTISKLLVGILAPQKGSIYYDDIELTEKTVDKIRNRVGIVFQNPDNQFVGVNVK